VVVVVEMAILLSLCQVVPRRGVITTAVDAILRIRRRRNVVGAIRPRRKIRSFDRPRLLIA
jgi:hypothetical protein